LQPMTADQLFSSVPPARSGGQSLARGLVPAHALPFPAASSVRQLRHDLAALAATYPTATAVRTAINQRLLSAESSALSSSARASAIGAVRQAMDRALGRVSLPAAVSLTLTARNGNLPITVVDRGALPARVSLQLSSEKLNFRPFRPPAGACQTSAAAVVCELRLTTPVTTLKVPVQTRTTGVFSLELALESPGGSVVLNQARYTVRSTAVSVVAIVLMVGAGLLLAVWWIRDRRHGKRASQLVVPPEERVGGGAGLGEAAGGGPAGADRDRAGDAARDRAGDAARGRSGDGDAAPAGAAGAGSAAPSGAGSAAPSGAGSAANGHDASDSRRRWQPPPMRPSEAPGAGRRR